MNRIIRDHYPVADLPENLREGFKPGQIVRVVIEPVVSPETVPAKRPLSLDELFALARPSFESVDAVTAHVRAMRDEEEDRR